MATKRMTDRQKADAAAERAFLRWVFGPEDQAPDLEARARRHLTIAAHWLGDEDGCECTCADCWPFPVDG